MAKSKTATLSFRIKPALKDALRVAAVREHRSVANMVEVMVMDYCGRNDISIPAQDTPAATSKSVATRRSRNR